MGNRPERLGTPTALCATRRFPRERPIYKSQSSTQMGPRHAEPVGGAGVRLDNLYQSR